MTIYLPTIIGQYWCGAAFYFLSFLSYTHKLSISRAVGAPGHGKCVCDAVSGNTKRKLTIAAGRSFKSDGENGSQSRKFGSSVKVDGKAFSASAECKRLMELEDEKYGAKNIVKSEKRESNRMIKEHHYWVRGSEEKLSALKYESP